MPSHVAGIVSADGKTFRTVITENGDDFLLYQVRPGERLFILPDLMVQEPVGIHAAGSVADQVVTHIRSLDASLLQPQPLVTAVTGPTKAGGAASNNTTLLTFQPIVVVPAGSFMIIAARTVKSSQPQPPKP